MKVSNNNMSQVTVWTCEDNEEMGVQSVEIDLGDWYFCSHAISRAEVVEL